MAYTNSSLVSYKKLTKNHSGQRNHIIDTITIHCYVGQVTAQSGVDYFYNQGELYQQWWVNPKTGKKERKGRGCSSNYIIGKNGDIGLSVEEKNRSWCTSSESNDQRAITIEVASDNKAPYAVTDAALNSLIKLCADICERNNIKELKWKNDKSLIGKPDQQNMTVHMWFANKACPGEYLLSKHSYIAEEVNKLLNKNKEVTVNKEPSSYAKVSCEKAVKLGVFKGDSKGDYMWHTPLTRQDFCVILDRLGLLK